MPGVKGRSGRKQKPRAVHEMQGTQRRDRHGGQLEAPAAESVAPPACLKLTAAEKKVWPEVTAMLNTIPGLLAEIDALAIGELCEAIVERNAARAEIKKHGATAMSQNGGAYQHPAVGRKNKAQERIRYWIARFGMSPSDRASISAQPATAAGTNPVADFFKGNLGAGQN